MRARRTAAALAVVVAGLVPVATTAGASVVTATSGPSATAATAAVLADEDVTVLDPVSGRVVEVHSMAGPAAAESLRATLRRAGRTVLPAGSSATSAAAASCPTYGTATSWCGHVWAYNGYNDPQVYFLDHTPAGYPVTNAVADWYQSPGIDAYYRWYTQGCPNTQVHCVNVYTYTAPAGEFGVTYWDPARPTAVTVKISNRLANTLQGRKSTCHELGHALGLGHNGSITSCMVTGRTYTAGDSYRPSSQDFTVLTLVYPKPGT